VTSEKDRMASTCVARMVESARSRSSRPLI
jgi:hypothetical protein